MAQEKVLPFIEHLVELRKRLIVIIIAVVIGMGSASGQRSFSARRNHLHPSLRFN